MSREVFQLYPRGFFGASFTYVPEAPPTAEEQSRQSLQVDQSLFTSALMNQGNAPIPVNVDAERLYAMRVNNAPNISSFDFQEQIIRVAMKAFGTDSFGAWITAQANSPKSSWAHSEYLIDTLRFLTEGQRNTVQESWPPLLSNRASPTEFDLEGVRAALKKFESVTGNKRMVNVIVRWCQQPYGVYDLLTSMHVMFGN